MKKLRVFNYHSDLLNAPCVWIGEIVELDKKDRSQSIVRLRNYKGEVKEDFLANLQISN